MIRRSLFVFFVVVYQLVVYVQATIPTRPFLRSEGTPSVDCVNGHCSKRTLFDIIGGCLTTTLICAWTAVHPNIPPREGPLKRFLRRLELMFWAIVAPEIIPCWALNQLLAAITVKNVYNQGRGYVEERSSVWKTVKQWGSMKEVIGSSRAWTPWHGHFLIMGGFHLVEPEDKFSSEKTGTEWSVSNSTTSLNSDIEQKKAPWRQGRVTVLTLELLRQLVADPDFEIQTTADEIMDKSKGDVLSKIIFLTQTTWFIAQCIARHAQGLDLTQLELTTVALASLNGITLFMWWNKPLGAQTPVRVYLRKPLKLQETQTPHHKFDRSDLITTILAFPLSFITTREEGCSLHILVARLILLLPLAIVLLPPSLILAFAVAAFYTISDLLVSRFPASNHATHVPTFYVPKHQYSQYWHLFLLVILGPIFGGIHCVCWNFSFPTHTYQQLWRIAAFAVTTIPVSTPTIVFVILFIRNLLDAIFRKPASFELPSLYEIATSSQFILTVFTFAYVVARFTLLSLALALLKNQPPSVFIALDWTKYYYPHF